MTTVLLDDAPVATLDAARTVGDVVTALQTQAKRAKRLITSVECDGRAMLGDELSAALTQPLDAVGRLTLHSEAQRTLVLSILRQASAVLADARELRMQIAEQLAQGRTAEAMSGLMAFVSVWSQTYSAIAQCAATMEIDLMRLTIDEQPVAGHIATVTDSLRLLKEALTDQDHVRLSDQMAYEIGPTLDAWQDVLRAMIQQVEGAAGD